MTSSPSLRASVPSSVIAVLSNTLSGYDAYRLLWMLTQDSDGNEVADYVRIQPSSSALYLMHLPDGVLRSVPYVAVADSPLGDVPSTLGDVVWNTVVDAATFLHDGLVATVSFIVEVAEHLVEIGLEFIGDLIESAVNVVEAIHGAVDAIVEGFKRLWNRSSSS